MVSPIAIQPAASTSLVLQLTLIRTIELAVSWPSLARALAYIAAISNDRSLSKSIKYLIRIKRSRSCCLLRSFATMLRRLPMIGSVSYTHLTLPTIYSV